MGYVWDSGISWDIHSWDICIQDHPSISIYRHYLYSSNRSISFRYHLFLYLSKRRSARWFTANQLKPRRGFRATVRQIGSMMELWFVRSSVSVELDFFWNGPESNILKLRKIWWHVMCRLHVFNVWECGNKMEEVWRSHALNQWTNKLYPIISHQIPHLYPCQSHLPNSINHCAAPKKLVAIGGRYFASLNARTAVVCQAKEKPLSSIKAKSLWLGILYM